MTKPQVVDSRFDFRGGRNTAISPDLLNPNELVDCTNARLSQSYGGFAKRTGSQRIHQVAFPGPIMGVTQWDTPSGKQVVVVSNGKLYYRNGFDYGPGFSSASTGSTARTTADQGVTAGWIDPDGVDDGVNALTGVALNTTSTVAAASRLYNQLGDPAIDSNIVAVDSIYTIEFTITADGTSLQNFPAGPTDAGVGASVEFEYSSDSGVTWHPVGSEYSVLAGIGEVNSQTFTVMLNINAGGFTHLWIRLILSVTASASQNAIGTGAGSVQIFSGSYKATNFPITWTTGAASLSLTEPAIFAPFRASDSGAPLVLYIGSGGHYFSWDGIGTLTQLDGTKNAPLATSIISYHTRMFAMSASNAVPGLLPKTIFWSIIGNATDFTPGTKAQGGSAVTDFLTGQQLSALEVIGSSLLMATKDSVMRFTGHASDDIVIAQDTEGISAEVGAVGPLALKRFENVAAMLSDRGPYVVTEVYAQPSGEQLNPDWQSLDGSNITKSSIEYNRTRKELLFAVPGANDGGLLKTVFSQAVRLQAWQGPWTYPFGINSMAKYFDVNNNPNVIAGCADGFVRLMDVGNLDDVLYDGTGGSNITMTVQIPVIHFGLPGLKKALKWILIQGNLPTTCNLTVEVSFDGASWTSFPVVPINNGEENYRVDIAGDSSQGFRCSIRFVDSSNQPVVINGFTLIGWNLQRTT